MIVQNLTAADHHLSKIFTLDSSFESTVFKSFYVSLPKAILNCPFFTSGNTTISLKFYMHTDSMKYIYQKPAIVQCTYSIVSGNVNIIVFSYILSYILQLQAVCPVKLPYTCMSLHEGRFTDCGIV